MSWSELLPELLVAIAEKLTEPGAYLRFRCVCSSWRSATQSLRIPPFPKIPWLILPSDHSSSLHHFYSFSEDRLYQLLLPKARNCDLLLGSSSSSGLLLFARNDYPTMLIHPFTKRRIDRINSRQINTFFIPSDLDNVCWDHSSSMIWWRYKRDVVCPSRRVNELKNITYSDDCFYVLTDEVPEVRIYDGMFNKKLTICPPIALTGCVIHTADLVVSPDELFLLVRLDGCDLPYSHIFWFDRHKVVAAVSGFKPYHAVLAGEEWKEVSGIGNCTIFVDFMHCFVVEAGCATGLKKNCIYSVLPKPSHHNPTLQNFYIQQFDLDDKSCQTLERKLSQYEIPASTCNYEPSWFLPNVNS
ncbi:hypothetical protein LUZ63_013047 [Rhynchospora breviuscula]|uniref:KIB1-4 beta-propeller domain-containing protein n=1 Tax=Rhynchospora breviuscula TaxID=2022672 RepID=A0A9Q0C7T6_9POAL|nr:hypothetical protein LUZ63_013047 [Rhynchospora breviuscula]